MTAPVDESDRKLICQELSLLFHRTQMSGSQALSLYIYIDEAGPCIPYSSCLQEVLWKYIFRLFLWNFYFVMQDRKYIKSDGLGNLLKEHHLLHWQKIAGLSGLEGISGGLQDTTLHKASSALRSDQAIQGFI